MPRVPNALLEDVNRPRLILRDAKMRSRRARSQRPLETEDAVRLATKGRRKLLPRGYKLKRGEGGGRRRENPALAGEEEGDEGMAPAIV